MRSGIALYLAIGLAMMAAVSVGTYYGFVRGQTQQARTLLQGETAYFLAQAGIAAALARFRNTRAPTALAKALLTLPAEEATAVPAEVLEGRTCPALAALLDLAGPQARLRIEMSLGRLKPIYSAGDSGSGIVYDKIEKVGWLQIVSAAADGPAERRLVTFKEVRVVSTTPYVLGKFTLFELEPDRGRVNGLDGLAYEKLSISSGRPRDASAPLPAALDNGPGPTPEERGWIFLGGGVRKINLTWGRTGDGEEWQLLDKTWKIASDPKAPKPLGADHELALMEKGFFSGIHADNDLLDDYDFDQPPDDPATDNAGLVHLYGTDSARSPTYVLGEVYRRYLSLRYLTRVSSGAYVSLPWSFATAWPPPPGPWKTAPAWDVRRDGFGGDFGLYRYSMTQVVEDSYNRSVDMMTQPQDKIDPARTLISPLRVRHRAGLADFLYKPVINNGDVQVRTQDGEKIFDGNLHGLTMADLQFAERAVYRMPAAAFDAFLSLERPRLPGILHVTGGGVRIDRPLALSEGGVLAVDGRVTLAAPVTVARGARPLVIASLTSDIVLQTAGPFEACLIALGGKIRGEGGGFQVTGGMAAATVEWSSLLAATRRSGLAWDPRLDPTAPERTHAIEMSPAREAFLLGGAR